MGDRLAFERLGWTGDSNLRMSNPPRPGMVDSLKIVCGYYSVCLQNTGEARTNSAHRGGVNAESKSISATLTYLTGMSTNPCFSTSILGRGPRHITSPPSPPKLSQQHHNRDTAIMGRVKPCRDDYEREKSIRLTKQDLLLHGK